METKDGNTTHETIQFHPGSPELPKEEVADESIVNTDDEIENFASEKKGDDENHRETEEKENSSTNNNIDNQGLDEEKDDYGIPKPERINGYETPVNELSENDSANSEKNSDDENPENDENKNPEKIIEVQSLGNENENPNSTENIDDENSEEDESEDPVEEPSEASEPIEWKTTRPNF